MGIQILVKVFISIHAKNLGNYIMCLEKISPLPSLLSQFQMSKLKLRSFFSWYWLFSHEFRNAYNMVLHKFGEKLYSGLVATMTAHLKEISKSIEAAQGDLFLEELNRKWNDHNKALQMIRDILMYMDRTYIPNTHKTPVHELGLNLWRDNVIHSSKIQSRLLSMLLELVHRERTGEVIDRGLMRNIIKMLMDLGSSVYQEDFEKPFLEVSAEFYMGESQKFIECCDCGDYLKKAELRLNEEIERVTHYLDVKSEVKITNVVEKEMIANHMMRLVHMENSGLVNMLLDDKYEDLGRMYNLFRRVPNGLSTIRDVMTSHLREIGKQLLLHLGILGFNNISIVWPQFVALAWETQEGHLKSQLSKYKCGHLKVPTPVSVIVSAAVFALAHLTPGEFPQLFVLGTALGFSYAQNRNLVIPIAIHAFWNSGVILLLTFLQLQGYDIKELLQAT
ncbi:hypothetical protein GOBAR_DD35519 [Gossypium barbadense]|nr:hypothetical protein GOBAR_DD35519 [Gossypium barbadense]